MKVLTIKEPFATLIMNEIKHIETRSWKTNYRGEIYIQASLSKIKKEIYERKELVKLFEKLDMHYGNIICNACLKDCVYMDEDFINKIKLNNQEYVCGYYDIGRYAWILDNIEIISPIKVKGKLGIWNYKKN